MVVEDNIYQKLYGIGRAIDKELRMGRATLSVQRQRVRRGARPERVRQSGAYVLCTDHAYDDYRSACRGLL